MQRKRLIVRLAVAVIILFALASVGRIFQLVYETSKQQRLINKKNEQITELAKNYQQYLDETAGKITQVPVDPRLISQITSDIFKKNPLTKLYVWMSNPQGEFIFGTPNPVFDRLNKAFDRYSRIIEADGYYLDRNDFLLKLVHRHEDIEFSQFESGVLPKESETFRRLLDKRLPESIKWRFYREDTNTGDYTKPVRLDLSVPVVDSDQQMLGTLYLKVDDYTVPTEQRRLRQESFLNEVLFPAFEGIFVFCLLLLWFLLPSWVYIDAQLRDVKNANRWALLTAVTFCFAWLIYLIIRPSTLKSFHCPQCEKELNGTKAFCPYCGFDLSGSFCPQCQYPIKSEWQFCPSCRTDLTHKPQEQVDPPEEKRK